MVNTVIVFQLKDVNRLRLRAEIPLLSREEELQDRFGGRCVSSRSGACGSVLVAMVMDRLAGVVRQDSVVKEMDESLERWTYLERKGVKAGYTLHTRRGR